MNESVSIQTLFSDLVKAQAEFPTLPKDKSGYGYKYTDLDTVISTVKPILAKHNLGFMQMLTNLDGRSAITTRIFNSSGEWIEDTTPLPDVAMAKTNAAQNLGAAITYMKRYTLCAMLGISSDEDVDGNAQMNAPKPQNNSKPQEMDAEKQKVINTLLATKKADGSFVFTPAEKKNFADWQKLHTQLESIAFLEQKIEERKGDAFPEDIPYDEKPLTEEETAGANASFDVKQMAG
ncbi:MAG: ERF family protein [Methanocorpusculum sp.]|nr:ERF family protein [Methanocorpusculum sp.]MBR5450195.1 ERF family protein [Methanocorpusculum sp.]